MRPKVYTIVVLVIATLACDERAQIVSAPTAPAPSPPGVPAPAGPAESTSGIVRDGHGTPVANATITLVPAGDITTTNERGEFRFDVSGSFNITAMKDGFETASRWNPRVPSVEMIIHQIVRIPVGEPARVVVTPNDKFEDQWLDCVMQARVVRIFASERVIVDVRVVADDNGPVEFSVGTMCGPTAAVVDIPAAGEVPIVVRTAWNTPTRTFTVIASRVR